VVAVVLRRLGRGAPLEILKQYIRQQRTLADRANPAPNGGACTRKIQLSS
jgi:hypothetical protein